MPIYHGKLTLRDAYCSAPPLTSSFRPPRLSRAEEARRPRAPLQRPVKQEVRESEADSVEFAFDEDIERPVKQEQPVKIKQDPRQLTLRIAAIQIRQPASSASTSSGEAPGPSGSGSGTAYRTKGLCQVLSSQLGPADPPRGKGRPKGSKSRPRIAISFGLPTPPERAASAKARKSSRPRKH